MEQSVVIIYVVMFLYKNYRYDSGEDDFDLRILYY